MINLFECKSINYIQIYGFKLNYGNNYEYIKTMLYRRWKADHDMLTQIISQRGLYVTLCQTQMPKG